MQEFLGLLIFILFIGFFVAFFYGLYRLMAWSTKRGDVRFAKNFVKLVENGKMPDKKLQKIYKSLLSEQKLVNKVRASRGLKIILFIFFGWIMIFLLHARNESYAVVKTEMIKRGLLAISE